MYGSVTTSRQEQENSAVMNSGQDPVVMNRRTFLKANDEQLAHSLRSSWPLRLRVPMLHLRVDVPYRLRLLSRTVTTTVTEMKNVKCQTSNVKWFSLLLLPLLMCVP